MLTEYVLVHRHHIGEKDVCQEEAPPFTGAHITHTWHGAPCIVKLSSILRAPLLRTPTLFHHTGAYRAAPTSTGLSPPIFPANRLNVNFTWLVLKARLIIIQIPQASF